MVEVAILKHHLLAKAQFYFTKLDHERIGQFQFYLPGLHGMHKNPKQKKFLQSQCHCNNQIRRNLLANCSSNTSHTKLEEDFS